MELIDYASKRGTVRAVQDLVAKALAEVPTTADPTNHVSATSLRQVPFSDMWLDIVPGADRTG